MDYLDRMLDHEQWAMGLLFDSSGGLSDEQLDRAFDIGQGSIRATFEHLVGNVEGYLAEFKGLEHVAAPENPSLANLRERYDAAFPPFAEVARQLRDQDRFEEVVLDYHQVKKTLGGLILEFLMHSDEHQTELVHMLVRLGVKDPVVDIGAREWELLNT
jgi:uncharacterized damage-inducible protein DinB